MAESDKDNDKDALKSWYKTALDKVVQEMIKNGAVKGVAVDAQPVWVLAYKILIAKVWDASQKSQFIWTISGEGVVTDHIPGSLAVTPQEAARHFSLKWQMDAERLLHLAQSKTRSESSREQMQAYTNKLIGFAEALYDLAAQDDVWKQKT